MDSQLLIMKNLKESVNWEIEKQRVELLDKLDDLISTWKGPLPDLLDVFRSEEIERLLVDSISYEPKEEKFFIRFSFIRFVADSGYKDRLEEGESSSRRTTALHLAARRNEIVIDCELFREYNSIMILKLIQIYDRCDVNYVDEFGLTHFHVACHYGCADVVEKYLELGEDPNCLLVGKGDSPLHLALYGRHVEAAQALVRAGADPNFANATGMTALHIICQRAKGPFDLAMLKTLLELTHDKYRPVQVNARDEFGKTPLHYAVEQLDEKLFEILLKNEADSHLSDYEGLTPLHIIFKTPRRQYSRTFKNMLLAIFKKISSPEQINAQDKLGKTPLHYALEQQQAEFFEILVENGANPNSADFEGLTSLHIIIKQNWGSKNYESFTNKFFDISRAKGQPVQIDARDKKGQTPLHYAVVKRNEQIVKWLLEKGADATLADTEGLTPLHITCDSLVAHYILQISSKKQQKVQVNAQDKLGRTPLHYAVCTDRRNYVTMLLAKGADPNSADSEGVTPLHIICQKKYDDGMAEFFFEICKQINRTVQVNVRDMLGRTPMQWAVAQFSPSAVDVLLAHGAELSGFVFPTGSRFDRKFKGRSACSKIQVDWKLKLASGALMIVERLQNAGYEWNRDDALEIMKLFKKYGMFEQLEEMEKRWYVGERFTSAAKKIMIVPSLSLYDLIRLRPEEADKHALTFEDYYSIEMHRLPLRSRKACSAHLAEKVARGFFRAWALEPFTQLIHWRLPQENCEMILEKSLMNKDFYNICLAATGQST
ncbi:tankyrase-like [Trichogramma pretiosum]|uniref:tankyrase-like n=1 Tax=Trichogramma pretiosum TaxID=7493 RepID=UPI000C71AC38|nr:tankyrase-like [Trichogramma pretiosum]